MGSTATISPASGTRAAGQRRFQLLDAMILVGATALGCGIDSWLSQAPNGCLAWSELRDAWRELSAHATHESWECVRDAGSQLGFMLILLVTPVIAMGTLALIPIRLLGPRPTRRRLVRQPGFLAATAIGVATAFGGLHFAILATAAWGRDFATEIVGEGGGVVFVPMLFGLAVLVAWATAWACGGWRAEPSWVDRLGRCLGTLWIVFAFGTTAVVVGVLSPQTQCAVRASVLQAGAGTGGATNASPAAPAGGGGADTNSRPHAAAQQ